ncbi:MAG: Ig-like domain-containing protein [Spirochaetaceae bacterium]|jgi:hypothetical protein|nr:Ig-like domain-containing protein [Spirochaetaceae bacterium]
MKIQIYILNILVCFILFFSCDVLRDAPFEVCAWGPGSGYFENIDDINISVLFSHTPDKVIVERAFSVTEDGVSLNGKIVWDDKRLYFIPFSPFERNKDYSINLETEACDERGVNLEKRFEARFTTRPYGERPIVISVKPEDESVLLERRQQIEINFSEAVDINSCLNDISFSPSMSGSWRLEDSNKTAVFTPKELWKNNETYKMTISNKFQSMAGRQLGSNFIRRFRANEDVEAPVLLSAAALNVDEEIVFELAEYDAGSEKINGIVMENASWENGYRVNLRFSEPVDISKLKNVFLIEPSVKFKIDTPPPYSGSIIISFNENPAWGSRFTMILGPGVKDAADNESRYTKVFKVFVNGIHSKPPSFAGFTLFKQEDNDSVKKINSYTANELFNTIEINNEDFPYDMSVESYIELYFETADSAKINLFSIMDLFRIESTNSALSFTPLFAAGADFVCDDDTEEFGGLYRVEIRGLLKNTTRGGIISFYIAPGLTDSYSNVNQEAMSIQLLK